MTTKSSSFGALGEEAVNKLAFGIDLGTTNSCIAVVRNGKAAEVIRLADGVTTMPSCLMWKGGSKFIVGKEAYNNRYKRSAVFSTKRTIGKGTMHELKYGRKTIEVSSKFVASEVLKAIVKEAEHSGYQGIKDVVITIPAYFDNNQVKETLEAGELAGLNVLRVMQEPTSASYAYTVGGTGNREETILVYDLGGGTFDVSVLQINIMEDQSLGEFGDMYGLESQEESQSIYRVLAVAGDNALGGDDIDQEFQNLILGRLRDKGVPVDGISKEDRAKLTLTLERLKKGGPGSYSFNQTFKIDGEVYPETIEVDGSDFETCFGKIYKKTYKITSELLAKHGLKGKISRIVLVGGTTKSELIRGYLRRDFPTSEVSSALNPDESVAMGAAVMANKIKFGDNSISSTDVLPIGIGIVSDDKLNIMIRSGQSIPYTYASNFTTVVDNQEAIEVEVRQGNSSVLEKSVSLGRLVIEGIPKKKAGGVNVQVGLKIDSNGLLSCTAKCDGKVHKAQIVNILSNQPSKVEVVDDREEKALAKWSKLAARLGGEYSGRIKSIIAELESGQLEFRAASGKISEIILDHTESANSNMLEGQEANE